MNKLQRYFFGPVRGLRVFFVVRTVLLIVAIDALRMAYATLGNPRYGFSELAIAHFEFLDRIQPLPTLSLRIGVLLCLAGLAAFAVLSPRRPILAAVALLQTWTWSMSILDNYQHHTFVSIVLWLLIAMPPIRWSDRSRDIEAGAFVALSASLGITYIFTAIAKLDAVWTNGAVIRRLTEPHGIDLGAYAATAAWSVIVFELYVGVSYLRAHRAGSITTFAMLAAFHLSAEWILDLSIGAFSFYMVAAAIAFQFPFPKKDPASVRVAQGNEDNERVRLAGHLDAARHRLSAKHDPSCATRANGGRLGVATER